MTNVIFVALNLLQTFLPGYVGDNLLDTRTATWLGIIGFKVDCRELFGTFFGKFGCVAIIVCWKVGEIGEVRVSDAMMRETLNIKY